MAAVLDTGQHLFLGCFVTAQLVRDDHAWDLLAVLQPLAEERLRGGLVATVLDEDIEDVTVRITCPPQVVRVPVDFQKNVVHEPLVSWAGTATPKLIGIGLPEPQTSWSYRFIRYHHATLSKQLLNGAVAQRKPVIQPDRVPDDLDREPEAFIGWNRRGIHAARSADIRQVSAP